MPSQAAIRIAISGGGLAGASLIHALLPYPHLDVHIFESAAAFKEAGAAIGIVQNARRALKLIGPSAIKCLEDAGAIPLQGVRRVMARGPDSGKEIDRIDATDQPITNIVHRAEFLRELLAGVPADRMHASKKLVKIEEPVDGSVTLTFADDTTHECDILIGADGIHSFVRKYLLGEDDPAASPVPAGWWFVQSLRPYEKGLAALGKEFVDLEYPVEFDYAGDGAFWMHNVLSKGSLVQSVISVKCDDAEAKENWKKTMSADTIREIFRNWPAPIPKAVDEVRLSSRM